MNCNRRLNGSAFSATSPNGEQINRDWLIYTPSSGKVFCYVCKLFANSTLSALAGAGFESWDHINRLSYHERSIKHQQAVTTYVT